MGRERKSSSAYSHMLVIQLFKSPVLGQNVCSLHTHVHFVIVMCLQKGVFLLKRRFMTFREKMYLLQLASDVRYKRAVMQEFICNASHRRLRKTETSNALHEMYVLQKNIGYKVDSVV